MEWFCSSGAEYFSYKTKEQVQYTVEGLGWPCMEAVKTYGLHATLEHIVSTGSLPKQDDHQDQMETPLLSSKIE